MEVLSQKSTDVVQEAATVEEVETWMSPIVTYPNNGTLPVDGATARKNRMKAPMYMLRDGVLFKKSFTAPLLRCVGPVEVETIVMEVHEGTCGMHSGFRTVVGKIMRLGYFWPSMYRDTKEIIKACASCQRHAPKIHMSAHELIHVTSAWPFYKWAIDLVGPFPDGKHLVVAIDFFTKWVEAKPLKSTTGKQIVNFVWEKIVCHFGIPHEIVSDNSKQFAHDPFRSWCDGLNIKQTFSSVAHPQANGQVKVTNKDIVAGIRARLDTDMKVQFNDESNIISLKENLDLLEERRDAAAIREASNKQKIAKYYNQRVKERAFRPGDFVWHNNNAIRVENTVKLGPNWESPYVIADALGNRAYNLKTHDGKFVPRIWYATNLKKFYV
ncbi:uncharacterized protein [Rutidosis leptorrhynchoides]|uniref:uncharacterized protein n=1 Tax=Rutidosis leptorrhynchoides TaxID=125765 RepID=UPI003A9A0659